MVYEERLLDAIERSTVVQHRRETWRLTFSKQNPLRANVRGARWNPPDVSALYTSLTEATARAEFKYIVEAQPIPPSDTISVHRLRVRLERVVELSELDLRQLGIKLQDLPDTLDGQLPCREVGGAVAFLGLEGLLVPSRRDPSGTNLVIYTDQVRPPDSSFDLVDSNEIDLGTLLGRRVP